MNEIAPGYIFDTVFWMEKSRDGKLALVARNINSAITGKRIVARDRRIVPGGKVRVKVESVSDSEILVSYLGLSDFKLREGVYIDPELKWQLETLLCSGRSILLEGPQGTGKTTISNALAVSLGMEFVFFNCSVCFEPSDFVGALQLIVDDNGAARTEWIPTPVLTAVYDASETPDKRYLIFLDELNRCRSFALNSIMSAIDASKRIFDPKKNQYVDIPENVQWIAAVNRGRQFSGTFTLDLAQLDRFAVLKIDYPPEASELAILRARYDMVKEKHIRKVVRIANLLRDDPEIASDLSMRATDEACMFLSYPTCQKSVSREKLLEILKTAFCNRLPGDIGDKDTEAGAAYVIIERNVLLELEDEPPEEA